MRESLTQEEIGALREATYREVVIAVDAVLREKDIMLTDDDGTAKGVVIEAINLAANKIEEAW